VKTNYGTLVDLVICAGKEGKPRHELILNIAARPRDQLTSGSLIVKAETIGKMFLGHGLVTNPLHFTMPLIRYRMYDVLRPAPVKVVPGPHLESDKAFKLLITLPPALQEQQRRQAMTATADQIGANLTRSGAALGAASTRSAAHRLAIPGLVERTRHVRCSARARGGNPRNNIAPNRALRRQWEGRGLRCGTFLPTSPRRCA
jgi:hypothetical protein